jgi:hypothetical protein
MRRVGRVWLSVAFAAIGGCVHGAPHDPIPPNEASPSYETTASAPQLWLEGLHEGDLLTYRVTMRDGRAVKAQLRVSRLVRRGGGVAARLEPTTGAPDDLVWPARWIAGDAAGLRDLGDPPLLRDPGIVPLDDDGRVVAPLQDDRPAAPDWALRLDSREGEEIGRGWAIDELDLEVEGPVRGEHCARLVRHENTRVAQLVVCANLGVADREVREGGIALLERWTLIAVGGAVRDRTEF